MQKIFDIDTCLLSSIVDINFAGKFHNMLSVFYFYLKHRQTVFVEYFEDASFCYDAKTPKFPHWRSIRDINLSSIHLQYWLALTKTKREKEFSIKVVISMQDNIVSELFQRKSALVWLEYWTYELTVNKLMLYIPTTLH